MLTRWPHGRDDELSTSRHRSFFRRPDVLGCAHRKCPTCRFIAESADSSTSMTLLASTDSCRQAASAAFIRDSAPMHSSTRAASNSPPSDRLLAAPLSEWAAARRLAGVTVGHRVPDLGQPHRKVLEKHPNDIGHQFRVAGEPVLQGRRVEGDWLDDGGLEPPSVSRSTTANSMSGSIGFERYPSMPAAKHRSRSLSRACAVMATMRTCWPVARSR